MINYLIFKTCKFDAKIGNFDNNKSNNAVLQKIFKLALLVCKHSFFIIQSGILSNATIGLTFRIL